MACKALWCHRLRFFRPRPVSFPYSFKRVEILAKYWGLANFAGGGGGSSENFPLRRRSLLKRSMSSDARVEWSTAPDVAPRPTVWVSDGDAGEIVKVPRGAGHLFSCDDEEGELFSNSYLSELVQGNQKLGKKRSFLYRELQLLSRSKSNFSYKSFVKIVIQLRIWWKMEF